MPLVLSIPLLSLPAPDAARTGFDGFRPSSGSVNLHPSASTIITLRLDSRRSPSLICDIWTRVRAGALATGATAGGSSLLALLCNHADAGGWLLQLLRITADMILQRVVLHGRRHIKGRRRGGGSVDGEIEMSGLGRGNKMRIGAWGKLESGVEGKLLLLLLLLLLM